MEKVLKTKRKIRFQDCDPFNHLNNSKYLDYLINAREDQIAESYGLDVFKFLKTSGNSWVVLANQISYIKPALTMETVLIETQLFQYTDKILWVEMKMWNEDETELKALLWTKFIHFNIKTQKIANHSADLMELFEKVVAPLPENTFDERSLAMMKKTKNLA